MKKRFFSILMALALCLTLLPTAALAADADDTGGTAAVQSTPQAQTAGSGASTPTGTALTQESIEKLANSGWYVLKDGTYYLSEDVTLDLPLDIKGTVTLDLNGHVLELGGNYIRCIGSNELTLTDSNSSVEHKFRVEDSGLWVRDEENGTKTVKGGVITGGEGYKPYSDEAYGSVYVQGATFTMSGGNIVGCTSALNGGGVYVYNATFSMSGGSIVGCTASRDGGGVGVDGNSTFTMKSGGSIVGCIAAGDGGGVYVSGVTSVFTMEDGSSITACTAWRGGGVYTTTYNTGSGFTMKSGSSITSCTASGNGGGVYVGGGSFTMESDSSITSCSAAVGGGVYVYNDNHAAFTMNGGTISNCKAGNAYNAVHADGSFTDNSTTKIDKSLVTGINAGHTGMAEDPILIASAEGLKDFRDRVNGTGNYTSEDANTTLCATLLCDIVLNDGTFDADGNYTPGADGNSHAEQWTPIGWYKSSSDKAAYAGTFDGGGHTIKGLYVNVDGDLFAGLFGYTDGATIRNVTVDGYVKGTGDAGGIVGTMRQGTIGNCVNRCRVVAEGGAGDAGGIVGAFVDASISGCANTGAVSGTNRTGGIAGFSADGSVSSCYNTGAVSGTNQVGGIAGSSGGNASITSCYYLTGTAEKAVGEDTGSTVTSVEAKTKTEFAGGDVLALLKKNDTTGAWGECGYLAAAGMTLPLLSWQTADAHEHDGNWNSNEVKHWKECSCGKLIEEAHSGGSTCSVCGRVLRSSRNDDSSDHSYTVSVGKTEHGSVTVSPRSAEKGDTVTVTVTPDEGYTLETLTVTDKNGNELKLTDKGDGKYAFTMPGSRVTVTAAFMDDNAMLNFFVDVNPGAYYYDAVLWAAKNGVTSGTDAVHFSPNQPCTRAQIVTFLWRAAGSPVVDYAMNMTDVSEDAYYAEAVRWALSEGITTGTTAATFGPNETCTRAQAVAFLFRYAVPETVTLQELVSGFSDAASVPSYALSAMNWALAAGIVQGDGSRLMPNDSCTRAQIVTFLYRVLEK